MRVSRTATQVTTTMAACATAASKINPSGDAKRRSASARSGAWPATPCSNPRMKPITRPTASCASTVSATAATSATNTGQIRGCAGAGGGTGAAATTPGSDASGKCGGSCTMPLSLPFDHADRPQPGDLAADADGVDRVGDDAHVLVGSGLLFGQAR